MLTVAQNTTLRQIVNASWYFRNSAIHRELNILPIPNYLQALTTNFFNSLENELILDLTAYDPSVLGNRKRPLSIMYKNLS